MLNINEIKYNNTENQRNIASKEKKCYLCTQ